MVGEITERMLHYRDRLRGGLLEEQGNDFNQAANGDNQQDQNDHQPIVGLNFFM
jgi:hypothetical protein